MKTDNFFVIRINAERIITSIAVVLAILFAIILGTQNSRIEQLKVELIMKQGINKRLKNEIKDLQREKEDLESEKEDLESEKNALENRIYQLGNYNEY